jgi:hypothetical protein
VTRKDTSTTTKERKPANPAGRFEPDRHVSDGVTLGNVLSKGRRSKQQQEEEVMREEVVLGLQRGREAARCEVEARGKGDTKEEERRV